MSKVWLLALWALNHLLVWSVTKTMAEALQLTLDGHSPVTKWESYSREEKLKVVTYWEWQQFLPNMQEALKFEKKSYTGYKANSRSETVAKEASAWSLKREPGGFTCMPSRFFTSWSLSSIQQDGLQDSNNVQSVRTRVSQDSVCQCKSQLLHYLN